MQVNREIDFKSGALDGNPVLVQAIRGASLHRLSISQANGILWTMTELILIRHGQTPANVAGRWEG
jgi:hypothetical protein